MAREMNIHPFMEEGLNTFKNYKCSGIDTEALQLGFQKNIELMNKTQKIATETTQSVVELQNKYIKNTFEQWNDYLKNGLSKTSFPDKTTKQSEAANAMVAHTIKHAQQMNSIIAKSNEQLIDSYQKRFQEGLDECVNLIKAQKEQR